MISVYCGHCGGQLKELPNLPAQSREPCPYCGSMSRQYKVRVGQAEITPHSRLDCKGRKGGKGKPFVKLRVGADWSYKHRRWLRKDRLIDRRDDKYRETVTDPETGDIVHHREEPLSQHRGHGSDK